MKIIVVKTIDHCHPEFVWNNNTFECELIKFSVCVCILKVVDGDRMELCQPSRLFCLTQVATLQPRFESDDQL